MSAGTPEDTRRLERRRESSGLCPCTLAGGSSWMSSPVISTSRPLSLALLSPAPVTVVSAASHVPPSPLSAAIPAQGVPVMGESGPEPAPPSGDDAIRVGTASRCGRSRGIEGGEERERETMDVGMQSTGGNEGGGERWGRREEGGSIRLGRRESRGE